MGQRGGDKRAALGCPKPPSKAPCGGYWRLVFQHTERHCKRAGGEIRRGKTNRGDGQADTLTALKAYSAGSLNQNKIAKRTS